VVPQARDNGKDADAVTRQAIARLTETTMAARWSAERLRRGRYVGPVGSLGKLASSDIARQSARVHGSIAGAAGMLAGPEAPLKGIIAEILVSVPGISIAGGTDEIQHTIIGERMLGLPREPDVSKDLPFRDVPR
jgi:alkylation response protein AidB-like acyl-CoA dehydrogenase